MTKIKIFSLFSVCILFLFITPVTGQSIDTLIFRLNAGAGFTLIDLPTALEWDENYFEEWDKVNVKVNLQCEFLDFSSFRLGAEIGYNRLYYYYVSVPYPPFTPRVYEETVSAINISALGTYVSGNNLFIQAGVGPYFYGEGVTIGIKGALGYRISVGENVAVPISLVADLNTGDGTPFSFGLTVGIEYKLKLSKTDISDIY